MLDALPVVIDPLAVVETVSDLASLPEPLRVNPPPRPPSHPFFGSPSASKPVGYSLVGVAGGDERSWVVEIGEERASDAREPDVDEPVRLVPPKMRLCVDTTLSVMSQGAVPSGVHSPFWTTSAVRLEVRSTSGMVVSRKQDVSPVTASGLSLSSSPAGGLR